MKEFTLLGHSQARGHAKLSILTKYGVECAVTDFARLLGCELRENIYASDGTQEKDKSSSSWWTSTQQEEENARIIGLPEAEYYVYTSIWSGGHGYRPAIKYDQIKKESHNQKNNTAGVLEVEYGEYPQTIASPELSKELEEAYQNGTLQESGKSYTTEDMSAPGFHETFIELKRKEYEYGGKRYIRFAYSDYATEFRVYVSELSDKTPIKTDGVYWLEVEPITWLVDEEANIALAKKVLFTRIQYAKRITYDGTFKSTNIYKYLNTHFVKEIEVIRNLKTYFQHQKSQELAQLPVQTERRSRIQKMNPDTSSARQRRKMTDTEIIHSWIESGQSVLLRGPSGIGKTERIRSLYPDLIYIKLTNNMFPEKVVGSVNLQTGQNIPPDFAKQAIMSCATEEEKKLIEDNIQNLYALADTIYERSKSSDKKVVILLDELLNVKPAIQSLVYTLVLNRFVETGSGLKLPANTVIVATGNPKKYSSVAEDLAEPLEKRFDHIMDMQPKVSEWIQEYAIPNKVHPAVVGYIISKYIQNYGSETIGEMNYFYEEPEVGEQHLDQNGCKGRTNDPRGWVSISNMLYAFEEDLTNGKFIGKDVEELLQISLGTKLREEWAKEFYDFYNTPTLTVDDVVNHNYTEADLPQDTNERFACVTSLLLANEDQVSVCREFIRKYCDPEYLQLFDINWIGKDERRMEIISELQDLDQNDIEGEGRKK